MHLHNFNFYDEEEMEQESEEVFKQTKELLEKYQRELFSKVCDDLEDWMFERYQNVRRRYFEGIASFLLGKEHYSITDKESLQEWLKGLGFDQQQFRKKIYEDNKEDIIEAIGCDALYEKIENSFSSSFFKYWGFEDIYKGYPQSAIVRNLINYLIEKDEEGFKEYLNQLLDEKIEDKKQDLVELDNRINEKRNELAKILED